MAAEARFSREMVAARGLIVAARRLKWEKYHQNAAESPESDSNSEEVDITESESDEEDPLADILWTHINIILLLYYDSSIDL